MAKLFFSCSNLDKPIAEIITNYLSKKSVEIFYFEDAIHSGDLFKEKIKQALKECDKAVFLITTRYFNKPWLYLEFSPFWTEGKECFILYDDENLSIKEFIDPMRDRVINSYKNTEQMADFIHSVFEKLDIRKIANLYEIEAMVEDIIEADLEIGFEYRNDSYEVYRHEKNLQFLPVDDREKVDIARYYLEKRTDEDLNIFFKILSKIYVEPYKTGYALELIDRNKIEIVDQIVDSIFSNEALFIIAKRLIDKGDPDNALLTKIIQRVGSQNEAELRKIALYLLGKGYEYQKIFSITIEEFENKTELSKIIFKMIDTDRIDNEVFIRSIQMAKENRTVYKKVIRKIAKENTSDVAVDVLKDFFNYVRKNNMHELSKEIKELMEESNQSLLEKIDI